MNLNASINSEIIDLLQFFVTTLGDYWVEYFINYAWNGGAFMMLICKAV